MNSGVDGRGMNDENIKGCLLVLFVAYLDLYQYSPPFTTHTSPFSAMPLHAPVPFSFRLPRRNRLGTEGAQTVDRQVRGLIHFTGKALIIEWITTETTRRLTLKGLRTEVDDLPLETLEIPIRAVVEVKVEGGWWRPRVVIRAERKGLFEGVPGASAQQLELRIARGDREIAEQLCAEVERLRLPDLMHPVSRRRNLSLG